MTHPPTHPTPSRSRETSRRDDRERGGGGGGGDRGGGDRDRDRRRGGDDRDRDRKRSRRSHSRSRSRGKSSPTHPLTHPPYPPIATHPLMSFNPPSSPPPTHTDRSHRDRRAARSRSRDRDRGGSSRRGPPPPSRGRSAERDERSKEQRELDELTKDQRTVFVSQLVRLPPTHPPTLATHFSSFLLIHSYPPTHPFIKQQVVKADKRAVHAFPSNLPTYLPTHPPTHSSTNNRWSRRMRGPSAPSSPTLGRSAASLCCGTGPRRSTKVRKERRVGG